MNEELLKVLKEIRDELARANELKEVQLGILLVSEYKIINKKLVKEKNNE